MPEAVRNSVSMRSFSTGARAGMTFFSSSSEALCQPVASCEKPAAAKARSTTNSLLQMNDAALNGGGSCLGAIIHVQLTKNAVDVGLYGGLGDRKLLSDIAITVAGNDQ